MIRARAGDVFMLVIEPGNIDRLKAQKPIQIAVPQGTNHLLVYYSPDVEFMTDLIAQGVPFSEAFGSSLSRPEVHERPNNKPEPQFKNVKLSGEQA